MRYCLYKFIIREMIEDLRKGDEMIREINLTRGIFFTSIVSLALTIMQDLEFVQLEILLYVLIGLQALLIFLVVVFWSDICKSKFFINSSDNNDLRKKIRKSIQVVWVFSIIAEVVLLLLATHLISSARISGLLVIIAMITAYSFFLLQWMISLRDSAKEKNENIKARREYRDT